ncbi:MAG: antA/AntB antirepressor family protein [Deltaproteobacteria bacterium]|nr:antA/AntB antirepressor family protein [Deltaproteobacteria bacterium]
MASYEQGGDLPIMPLELGGALVRTVDPRDLFVALDLKGDPDAWFRNRAVKMKFREGRDWIRVQDGPKRNEFARRVLLSSAVELACTEKTEARHEVRRALVRFMSPTATPVEEALTAEVAALKAKVAKLEGKAAVRKRGAGAGRPRRMPPSGRNDANVALVESWKKVRIEVWDMSASGEPALNPRTGKLSGRAAAMEKSVRQLLRECGAKEPAHWRFARALERAAAKLGSPFTFGAVRRQTPYYPTDTAKMMMMLLEVQGALSKETRPNANGIQTDYWTAERIPMYPSDWGWYRECVRAAEGKLEPRECPNGLLVRGVTVRSEEEGFGKLSGEFPSGA